MEGRLKTGIEGLDSLLDGGFLYQNAILIKGPAGAGKTTLGFQIVRNGILQYGESALVVSFDQLPRQFKRDMASFGWDLDALTASGKLEALFVAPEDLVPATSYADSGVIGRITEAAERIGAVRVLIDNVSHFKRATADPMAQRTLLMGFINQLKNMGLTPILTAEVTARGDDPFEFEEYISDCVALLELRNQPGYPLPERTIEIRKARGQKHLGGKHLLKFTNEGIEIFPHRLPEAVGPRDLGDYSLKPVPCGIAGLDRMLQGGFTSGAASCVAGVSGTYKSTILAHFMAAGAAAGEPGLMVSFEEPTPYLVETMKRRGIDLATGVENGSLLIWHRVPKACQLDELYHEIAHDVLARGTRRVAIDSLNDFNRCVPDPERCKDYLGMFNDLLMRNGATALYSQKIDHLHDRSPIGDIRCLSQFDTVIFVGQVEIESDLRKVVSILKRRGDNYESALRAIECTRTGLIVSEKFHGLEGILEGTPRGHYKRTVEDLLQPVVSARDFLTLAGRSDLPADQREVLYQNVAGLLNDLYGRLKDHFGIEEPHP
jgi:circadian clock protein KaiC